MTQEGVVTRATASRPRRQRLSARADALRTTAATAARSRSPMRSWTSADRWAAAIVVVSLVPRVWTVAQSWFWQDDFVVASMATRDPVVDYLLQDYNGHLMPAKFAVMWLHTTLTPGSWAVAATLVVVLSATAVAVWWWALRTVFGPRLALLVPLAVVAFCPIPTVSVSWWASALEALPVQIAMGVAVAGHVIAVRDGRRVGLVWSFLALAIGLAWIEKTLLVLLVLAWLDLVLMRGTRRAMPRRTVVGVWAGYVLVAAAYLALYRSRVSDPTDRGIDTDAIPTFLYDSLLSTFPVGMLGGPWQQKLDSSTLLPLMVQPWLAWVWVVVALVIAASFRLRGTAALRGWSLLVVYLGIAVGLVASTRLDFLGPAIGRDPRYLTDVVPIAALSLAAAFLPTRDALARVSWPRWRGGLVSPPALVGAAVTLYFLSSWVSTYRIADARGATGAREWVESARESLADSGSVVLYDTTVPPFVVEAFFDEYAHQSRVLESIGVSATFDKPTVDLRMLDGQGIAQETQLIVSAASDPGPIDGCGWLVTGRPVTIPVPAVDDEPGWVVRIGYYSAGASEPRIDIGDESWTVPLPAGLHDLSLFPQGGLETVRISGLAGEQRLCVTNVDVGRAWPKGQPLPSG